MALQERDYILIEKFLSHSLEGDEVEEMDRRIQEDEEFAGEVATLVAAKKSYWNQRGEELRAEFKKKREPSPKPFPAWAYALAAIVALSLIGLAVWYIWFRDTPVDEPAPPTVIERPSEQIQANAVLDPIVERDRTQLQNMGGYSDGWHEDLLAHNYPEALRKLDALLAGIDNLRLVPWAAYYAGLLHIYLDVEPASPSKAIRYLKPISEGEPLIQDAPTYLFLAYEKSEQMSAGRDFFEKNPSLQAALPDSLRANLRR